MADSIRANAQASANAQADLTIGNLSWHYRQQAPAGVTTPPVALFLHGVPITSLSWTGVIPKVAEAGWRCVAPDWIGLGGSSKPQKQDFPYTPEAYLEALSAFIDAMEIEKMAIVAQGFLGSVGIQYALKYPEKVDRLTIVSAPIFPVNPMPWPLRKLGLPVAGEMLCQDPLSSERILEKGCKFVILEEFLQEYRRPFTKSSDPGFALLAIMRNIQVAKVSQEISVGLSQATFPVQVIWGEKDPWLDVDVAKQATKLIPKGEFKAIDTAGHYPQEHFYDQIGDLLVNFLKRTVF
jgi:pimeloyl-ACP methyl ester carboxylesterase